jgi:hypothetical protein
MGDDLQPVLFDVPADRFSEMEQGDIGRNPEFTAARFLQIHPREYQEIMTLRAELVPIATLARMYHVSRNTIAAIDERASGNVRVEQLKQTNARAYNRLATICRERAQELVLSVDVDGMTNGERIAAGRVLAILMGVAEDKAQLLAGQATSRAEVGDPRAAAAEFAAALSRMGFGVADPGAKGAAPAGIEAARVVEVEVGPASPVAAAAVDLAPGDGGQDGASSDM